MHYSKPMIDLILELRRRVPSDLKPSIKLANPLVLDELIAHYPSSKDNVTRALIKELLIMAGSPWLEKLEQPQTAPTDPAAPKPQVKVYRGQTTLTETPPTNSKAANPERPTRIYRGQVISM